MDSSGHGQANASQHEGADATTQKTADLTAFVQNLLLQMQTRFQTMSESIITKIDEMGSRIDDLERSIGELVKETGHVDAMPAPPSNSSYQELRGGSAK
jgi:heat shock factor-binding protein 1